MKRVPSEEWLDSDRGTPAEVAGSLQDLKSINSRFGGAATSAAMLRRVTKEAGRSKLSILEAAAGAGDTSRLVKQLVNKENINVTFTLLDRAPSHLFNGSNEFIRVAGDALALPFSDSSFDLVSCNLFVHHLSPDQALQFAKEALRVCRVALLVNDLVRSPIHLALVYASTPLYKSRLTRHDAPASVRQAYTPTEMVGILTNAGAARTDVSRHFLYRMGVIAWK